MHDTIDLLHLPKRLYQIAWHPSHLAEYKLNTDGVSSSNTCMAGIGVLIQDINGISLLHWQLT